MRVGELAALGGLGALDLRLEIVARRAVAGNAVLAGDCHVVDRQAAPVGHAGVAPPAQLGAGGLAFRQVDFVSALAADDVHGAVPALLFGIPVRFACAGHRNHAAFAAANLRLALMMHLRPPVS